MMKLSTFAAAALLILVLSSTTTEARFRGGSSTLKLNRKTKQRAARALHELHGSEESSPESRFGTTIVLVSEGGADKINSYKGKPKKTKPPAQTKTPTAAAMTTKEPAAAMIKKAMIAKIPKISNKPRSTMAPSQTTTKEPAAAMIKKAMIAKIPKILNKPRRTMVPSQTKGPVVASTSAPATAVMAGTTSAPATKAPRYGMKMDRSRMMQKPSNASKSPSPSSFSSGTGTGAPVTM
jgi:hypothetical protein